MPNSPERYHESAIAELRDHVLLGKVKCLVNGKAMSDDLRVAPPAMICKRPYSPWMVVSLTCCLMAAVNRLGYSQEYNSMVNDRVEAELPQPALAEPEAELRGGWDLGAVISAAYDNNIFLSASDAKADTVFRIAPLVAYTKGDEKEGEGFFVKAGYRPTAVAYAENGSDNRIDQQALLTAGWRGKLSRVTYAGVIQKLGDATAETGRPTDRLELSNEIRAAWIPREKITLEIGAANRQTRYDDPTLIDSNNTYVEAALRYTYSPKTELGLIYQTGRLRMDGAGPQDTRQLAGSISWQPREKIRLDLRAGAEHRKTDSGTEVNPVLQGRIEWAPRKGTDIYLTGYMREEASAFFAGQIYSVRGVAGGISQRLGGPWTAKLEGGYERNLYQDVPGTAAAKRNDDIWFVRPAVSYRLGDESDVSLFYRASSDASTDSNFGYDQQILGVEFNHRF